MLNNYSSWCSKTDLFMSKARIQSELFLQWDKINLGGIVLEYSVGLIIINLDKF